MRRALVTGSAGFLGRHLAAELTDRGYEVYHLDSAVNAHEDVRLMLPQLTTKFDVAVHAAAVVGGRETIDGHRTYLGARNLQLDACFFEWALRERPRHVVYLSSSAVYPVDLQGPETHVRLSEPMGGPLGTHPGPPDATYGFTKLVGETLAHELSQEVPDVAVHVVRPFSGYGADQDPAYPFRAFVDRARRRDDPFVVWGTGQQVRDWVHVDDVVGATLAVVDQDYREPLNVCTGRGTRFLELAAWCMVAAGYHGLVEPRPDAPTGVHHRVGNPTRLRDVYVPKVTLEEGIRRALAA